MWYTICTMKIERAIEMVEEVYDTRFIRVKNDIFISKGDELYHDELAEKDQIQKTVNELRYTAPDDVDAGFFTVMNNPEKIIYVAKHSTTLRIPTSENARKITVTLFQQNNPEYKTVSIVSDLFVFEK